MSASFTKLFSSITASTVWCEDPETKVVWITLLAMTDAKGRIWASVPGLAAIARVSLEATERALEKFRQPDKYSRTKDNEGRRIEDTEGGWRILNYDKYRTLRDEEERREYKRNWIADKRAKTPNSVDNVDNGVDKRRQSRPPYTNAEAEAEADKNKNNTTSSKTDSTDGTQPAAGADEQIKSGKRGTRIKIPFELTNDMLRWAAENTPTLELSVETSEFVDYWKGVPGARGTKLDWEATWRNRMRDVYKRNLSRQPRSYAGAATVTEARTHRKFGS